MSPSAPSPKPKKKPPLWRSDAGSQIFIEKLNRAPARVDQLQAVEAMACAGIESSSRKGTRPLQQLLQRQSLADRNHAIFFAVQYQDRRHPLKTA